MNEMENLIIPDTFDYNKLASLGRKQRKLIKVKPPPWVRQTVYRVSTKWYTNTDGVYGEDSIMNW